MLRRTWLRRSGGHGDFLPNSKAGGHVDFPFVLSRPSEPAAGHGMRYVTTTHAAPASKFQSVSPVVRVRTRVPLPRAAPACAYDSHDTRMTPALADDTASPIRDYALRAHYAKRYDNATARDNIANNAASERRMQTCASVADKRPVRSSPYDVRDIDPAACTAFLEARTPNLLGKTIDLTTNGSVRELFPWTLPASVAARHGLDGSATSGKC